jgi:hypothetical protein
VNSTKQTTHVKPRVQKQATVTPNAHPDVSSYLGTFSACDARPRADVPNRQTKALACAPYGLVVGGGPPANPPTKTDRQTERQTARQTEPKTRALTCCFSLGAARLRARPPLTPSVGGGARSDRGPPSSSSSSSAACQARLSTAPVARSAAAWEARVCPLPRPVTRSGAGTRLVAARPPTPFPRVVPSRAACPRSAGAPGAA